VDLLHAIGDLWVRRRARPRQFAIDEVNSLTPVTVVTGASAGLGYALAERLAREKRCVLLLARHWDKLHQRASELETRYPGARVFALDYDVGKEDFGAVEAFLAERKLYLDVLVNNAGIALAGIYAEQNAESIDELLATNVVAVARLTRRVLPGMRARGRGGIMNIASLGSFTPGPGQAAYFASKAFVLSLTAAIGAECSGEGVRICAIAFGPVDTGIHEEMAGTQSYYRRLLPSGRADRMARLAWRSYRLGRRVVVPGAVNGFLAYGAKAMPYELLLPFVGWLMRPR
jgi:short-subunit dehydrogenase